jgi:flagellar protein FliS
VNSRSAAAAYKAAHYESAPPLKLVQLMYEGALRFLAQAEAAAASDPARFRERCSRAQAVISELRLSLEPQHAPELAEHLTALYLFAETEIQKALLAGDPAPLAPVGDVLSTLLDGWKRIEVAR